MDRRPGISCRCSWPHIGDHIISNTAGCSQRTAVAEFVFSIMQSARTFHLEDKVCRMFNNSV